MNFVRLDDWTVQLAIIASNGVGGGGSCSLSHSAEIDANVHAPKTDQ